MKDKYHIPELSSLKKWANGLTIVGIILIIILWFIGHKNWLDRTEGIDFDDYSQTIFSNETTYYASYILGSIALGLAFTLIGIILWIVYAYEESCKKSLLKKNYKNKLKVLESNETFGHEFKAKWNSLVDLYNNSIINYSEYEEKKQDLIIEYESKVDFLESQKILDNQIEKLKNAHSNGVLSKEEYEERLEKLKSNKTGSNSLDVDSLISKAKNFYDDKKFSECIALLNRALDLDNKSNSTLSLRANALYQNGQYIEARNDFNVLISRSKFISEYLYQLGNIEIKLGNQESAVKYWTKCKDAYPKAIIQLDFYSTFRNQYFLEASEVSRKLGKEMKGFSTYDGIVKYINGLPEFDKKTNVLFNLFENGINITFKTSVSIVKYESTDFSIAFNEIKEIKEMLENGYYLEIVLFDNKTIQFKYYAKRDLNNNFRTFLNKLKSELE